MEGYVSVMLVLKDGGFENFQIPPRMLGQLAMNIKEKGSEKVITTEKEFEVVGIFVKGDITVPGVIMIGKLEE